MSTIKYYSKLKWIEYNQHVGEMAKQYFYTGTCCDVELFVENKQINVHKVVLSAASDFFNKILVDVPVGEKACISIPDIDLKIVQLILQYIYTGEVGIESKDFNYFVNVCNFFGVKSFLKFDGAHNDVHIKDGQNSINYVDDLIEYEEEKIDLLQDVNNCTHTDNDEGTVITKHDTNTNVLNINSSNEKLLNTVIEPQENSVEFKQSKTNSKLHNTNKNPNLTLKKSKVNEIIINKAIEELKAGKSLRDVTLKYKIPRSTLYFRAKQQLVNLKKRSQGLSRYSYLSEAIMCVMRGQMSYQRAEHHFNIPKSIIWRHVKKFDQNSENVTTESHVQLPPQKKNTEDIDHPIVEQSTESDVMNLNKVPKKSSKLTKSMAINELELGKTLSEVSKKYNIPISTLYREKKKLYLAGKLPQTSSVKSYRSGEDFKEKVRLAVEACQKGVSQGTASCMYNVPKTTIWRHLKQWNKTQNKSS